MQLLLNLFFHVVIIILLFKGTLRVEGLESRGRGGVRRRKRRSHRWRWRRRRPACQSPEERSGRHVNQEARSLGPPDGWAQPLWPVSGRLTPATVTVIHRLFPASVLFRVNWNVTSQKQTKTLREGLWELAQWQGQKHWLVWKHWLAFLSLFSHWITSNVIKMKSVEIMLFERRPSADKRQPNGRLRRLPPLSEVFIFS